MIQFLKGISPSLKQEVCNHVFSLMLNLNDVMTQYIQGTTQTEGKALMDHMLGVMIIEFVTPEQIILN